MTLADQIEALAAKATPGPWFTLDPPWLPPDAETSILAESPDPHVARFLCDFDLWALDENDRKGKNPDEDAALIVALRNAVPTILAALRDTEALRAENAMLREAIANIANTVNVEDGPYYTLLKAADGWLSWIKKEARAALKDTGHE